MNKYNKKIKIKIMNKYNKKIKNKKKIIIKLILKKI